MDRGGRDVFGREQASPFIGQRKSPSFRTEERYDSSPIFRHKGGLSAASREMWYSERR